MTIGCNKLTVLGGSRVTEATDGIPVTQAPPATLRRSKNATILPCRDAPRTGQPIVAGTDYDCIETVRGNPGGPCCTETLIRRLSILAAAIPCSLKLIP
jgi:hypothetical protein